MSGVPARRNPSVVRHSRLIALSAILLAAAFITVAFIVFSPAPPDIDGQQRLARWLAHAHQFWLPRWVTFDVVEFAANIVMFLPLGFLGAVVFPRAKRLVLAACALFSTAVELIQLVALPARQGDWHDVLANTLGAAAGIGVAILAGWATPDRGPADVDRPEA